MDKVVEIRARLDGDKIRVNFDGTAEDLFAILLALQGSYYDELANRAGLEFALEILDTQTELLKTSLKVKSNGNA